MCGCLEGLDGVIGVVVLQVGDCDCEVEFDGVVQRQFVGGMVECLCCDVDCLVWVVGVDVCLCCEVGGEFV